MGRVIFKIGSSRTEILLSFNGVGLFTCLIWVLKPLSVIKLSSQWMHLKTVLVVTVGNTRSVADEFEVDEITESVDVPLN